MDNKENKMGSEWQKAPQDLVDFFKTLWTDEPEVQLRSMFGYPCAFINGQMFNGLFGDRMFLRLSESDRQKFQSLPGAGPFEPLPGRVMKEYVLVPATMLSKEDEMRGWLAISKTFAASLPLKVKKSKK